MHGRRPTIADYYMQKANVQEKMRSFLRTHKGIVACVVAIIIYTGGDLWQTLIWDPFYSLDETLEVDYVYQLTQGQLPTFWGGAKFNPLHLHYYADVQFRYQHPPLFYLLEVPVFLIFRPMEHPILGIWAMRGLVYVLGVTAIVISYRAAQWIIGHEHISVPIVPIIFASNRCLPSVTFNYTLAALWVTLLIGMTSRLIRSQAHERTARVRWMWLFAVLLAPLTRLSTVPIMLLCLGVLAISLLVKRQVSRGRDLLLLVVLPLFAAIASSAWFYLRLYRLSGNFTGSQPQWAAEYFGRNIHRTFVEAATSVDFYKHTLSQYHNMVTVTDGPYGWLFLATLVIAPLLLGVVACVRHLCGSRSRSGPDPALGGVRSDDMLIFAMLICAFGGTWFQQVLFYRQGGSDNAVYFSLINIVFATFIALGLTQWRVIWKPAMSLWLLVRFIALLYEARVNLSYADAAVPGGAIPLAHVSPQMRLALIASLALVGVGTACGLLLIGMQRRPRRGRHARI